MQLYIQRAKKLSITAMMLAAAAVAAFALLTGGADGAVKDRTIETAGGGTFKPNKELSFTLHFKPGKTKIDSGGTLTLTHADDTDQPHTLSIVNADEIPGDIDAVFGCGEPETVCDEVFQLFGPEEDPDLLPRVVEGPGTEAGIDGRLDSLLVFEGESVSAEVTAEPGTTLNFICAIHAWMQGTIEVK